ncbi:MAG: malonyl-CoA decarboxylase [Rhizobiaceae bacterium]
MKTTSFIQDIIASVLDRRFSIGSGQDGRPIEELCGELLSRRGEVSSNQIGSAILNKYAKFDDEEKLSFFEFLTESLDLNAESVERHARAYQEDASTETLQMLIEAAEPPRQELLRRLNHVPGATAALVSMRQDLLAFLQQHPSLKRTDIDFSHLLMSWFNRGFLVMRPISWEAPANILAKIIQYEAVHAINDWDDLRRRLQPGDRRCFAFFHPSMSDEPLVFVEVALCKGIPTSVQGVLSEDRSTLNPEQSDTAAFYSISNCQKGLKGISFGNSLIKQVVRVLSQEMPNLKTFVTLSPIPGLSDWVSNSGDELPEFLASSLADIQADAVNNGDLAGIETEADNLKALAARYLALTKRNDGLPLDPVARFHLGNGASIYDVHAMADTSTNGLNQSFGVMVNYLYDIPKVEKHHEDFARDGTVNTSRSIQSKAASKLSHTISIANKGEDA